MASNYEEITRKFGNWEFFSYRLNILGPIPQLLMTVSVYYIVS